MSCSIWTHHTAWYEKWLRQYLICYGCPAALIKQIPSNKLSIATRYIIYLSWESTFESHAHFLACDIRKPQQNSIQYCTTRYHQSTWMTKMFAIALNLQVQRYSHKFRFICIIFAFDMSTCMICFLPNSHLVSKLNQTCQSTEKNTYQKTT